MKHSWQFWQNSIIHAESEFILRYCEVIFYPFTSSIRVSDFFICVSCLLFIRANTTQLCHWLWINIKCPHSGVMIQLFYSSMYTFVSSQGIVTYVLGNWRWKNEMHVVIKNKLIFLKCGSHIKFSKLDTLFGKASVKKEKLQVEGMHFDY